MKKFEKGFNLKIDEVTEKIKSVTSSESISPNTKSTQLVKFRKERKSLKLINNLLKLLPEDSVLGKDDLETISSLMMLTADRVSAAVSCVEGDSILELMKKYESSKNLLNKLQVFCEKNALKLNFSSGKVEKL